jgi:basic membrane protein A
MTLMDQGADVLSFQVASTAVMAAAQERGKMAIAFHSDMRKDGPDAQLLAVTHHWGGYYAERVKAVRSGQWTTGDVWGGVRQGMVRVGDFGPRLPAAVRNEVLQRQKDMAAGKLQPFQAGQLPVRDNTGAVRIPAGQTLSDAQVLQMDWLVEGVNGSVQ